MDVSEMISFLNDSGFTDTTTTRKVAAINDALYDAASRQTWPHLLTTITLTFDGTSAVPTNLPSNLGTVYRAIALPNNYVLTPVRLDDIDGRGVDLTQVGPPQEYYFTGSSLNFWPVPTSDVTVRLRYYKIPAAVTDTTLSAAIDWPYNHHQALVLGAVYRLYDIEDDPENSVRAEQHFEKRLADMIGDQIPQQVDRDEYIHPVAGFDYDWYE